jgi:hypothetical protein
MTEGRGSSGADLTERTVLQDTKDNVTRATARLPGLDIEIVHQQSPNADAEEITIHLRAMPSFEAFGQFLQTANPFAFWTRAAQTAWLPWFETTRALMASWNVDREQAKLKAPD